MKKDDEKKEMDTRLKHLKDAQEENLSYWCREAGPAGPMLWAFGTLVKFLAK